MDGTTIPTHRRALACVCASAVPRGASSDRARLLNSVGKRARMERVSLPGGDLLQDENACDLQVRPLGEHDLLRLPDASVGGVEGDLGRANERRLADARSRVDPIFDLSGAIEMCAGDPSTTKLIEIGLSVTVEEVWDAVDVAARHDGLSPGRISFGLAGADEGIDDEVPFVTTYGVNRPSVGAVAAKVVGRASLVVNGLEWFVPALEALVADLETVGGRPASAGVVLLAAGAVHLEDLATDVLILPLDSRVEAVSLVRAVGSGDDPAAGAEACSPEMILEPGWGVVSPRGRMLRLSAPDHAMALRVELPWSSEWEQTIGASAVSCYHPLLRADLPTLLDRPIESYAGSLYEAPSVWRAEVRSVLTPAALDHWAARARASLAPRASRRAGLSEAIDMCSELMGRARSPLHGGVMITSRDGAVELAAGGAAFKLDGHLLEVVSPHLDGRPFDLGRLSSAIAVALGGDRGRAGRLVADLLHHEVLEPGP